MQVRAGAPTATSCVFTRIIARWFLDFIIYFPVLENNQAFFWVAASLQAESAAFLALLLLLTSWWWAPEITKASLHQRSQEGLMLRKCPLNERIMQIPCSGDAIQSQRLSLFDCHYCSTHPDLKQFGEGKGLFGLHFQVTITHWRKSG